MFSASIQVYTESFFLQKQTKIRSMPISFNFYYYSLEHLQHIAHTYNYDTFYKYMSYCQYLTTIQCLFSEPNASPTTVQGHNTSSTSVLVQWGTVPADDQNGIILSYTVIYKMLPDGSPQTKVVSAPTTQVKLTGLDEYTNYSIAVFASTVKGDGNVSVPIVVITDEDSKYILNYFWVEISVVIIVSCCYYYISYGWF